MAVAVAHVAVYASSVVATAVVLVRMSVVSRRLRAELAGPAASARSVGNVAGFGGILGSMSSKPLPSAVLFVSQVERVASFYISLADMRRVAGDESHAVLEVDGFQLVVHKQRGGPKPSEPVVVREGSSWKLCLPVTSIAEARERARQAGGFVKPASVEWEARGFRACDGHDPEGNVIQVREPATSPA